MRRGLIMFSIVAALLGALGCNAQCKDSEATSFAVYHQLQKTLHGWNDVNVWIDKPSIAQLDAEQKEINRLREWAKTVKDPCVRKEYSGWLTDYFQHGLNEAYDEVRNHKQAKEMDAYERDTTNTMRKADAMKIEHPSR